MGWALGSGEYSDRLPVDSRFVDKVFRGVSSGAEQTGSNFVKKYKSARGYKTQANLPADEREIYVYVQDLLANNLPVDPVAIETVLLSSSPKFASKASKYYSGDSSTKAKLGDKLELPVEEPTGTYVSNILSSLQSRGLLSYT